TGRDLSITASRKLKIAVFAPIPSVRTSTATTVKAGCERTVSARTVDPAWSGSRSSCTVPGRDLGFGRVPWPFSSALLKEYNRPFQRELGKDGVEIGLRCFSRPGEPKVRGTFAPVSDSPRRRFPLA